MSGALIRPTSGVRYALVRDVASDITDKVVYRGFAHLSDTDLALDVVVALPSGATTAMFSAKDGSIAEGGDEGNDKHQELLKAAAALVRSATKTAASSGGPFPRKIVRWR